MSGIQTPTYKSRNNKLEDLRIKNDTEIVHLAMMKSVQSILY